MESGSANRLTQHEKQRLLDSVANAAMKDILSREDMVQILQICRDAFNRRIEEIERRTTPDGPVQ